MTNVKEHLRMWPNMRFKMLSGERISVVAGYNEVDREMAYSISISRLSYPTSQTSWTKFVNLPTISFTKTRASLYYCLSLSISMASSTLYSRARSNSPLRDLLLMSLLSNSFSSLFTSASHLDRFSVFFWISDSNDCKIDPRSSKTRSAISFEILTSPNYLSR